MNNDILERQHEKNLSLIEEAKKSGDFTKVLASLKETQELLKQISEEQLAEMEKIFRAH